MKIIFFGTPDFVLPVLKILRQHYEVAAVITNPDQKSGRKQIPVKTPVKIRAEENNIQVFTPKNLDEQFETNIASLAPNLFVVAAYGKIIPETMLQIPKWGAINIHPSKLPKYRGPSPLQSLILDGENHSNISFIQMDAKMDHGPILSTLPFIIKNNDTFKTLAIRVFQEAAEMLPTVIDKYIKGGISPVPQDDSQSTYCQRISRQSGYIDLSNPPEKDIFNRMIRAYYPWPGVWTRLRGLVSSSTHRSGGFGEQAAEKIIKFFPSVSHPERGKGSQKFLLQMEGKNIVSYPTFVSGYPGIKPLLDPLISEE